MDSPRLFPAANLLSAVEVEVLAREIEKLQPVEAVAADIESLFLTAAQPKKPIPAKFRRHEQLRKTAEKIYLAALKHVLAEAEAEVLANLRSSKAILGVRARSADGFAASGIKVPYNRNSEEAVKAGAPFGNDNAAKGHTASGKEEFHAHRVAIENRLADRNGKTFPKKYFKWADKNFPPNTVAEYRTNGVVTKEGEKFTLNAPANTSEPAEKWRHYPIDVSEQFKVKASFVRATAPAAASINFDLKSFAGSFLDAMGKASKAAWQVTSRGLLTELGVGEHETSQGIVNDFIERRANKISGCLENIWEKIDRSIREGIDGGETMDELSDRVEGEFGDIEDGRAELIASTESQALYGTAQADAIDRAGFATKRWVSMDDSLVRPSHADCEAEGDIPIDEAFSNGLMFPGDPDADDAGEVCNCRCYLAAGISEDDTEEDDTEEDGE